MLWREAYRTQVARDVLLPSVDVVGEWLPGDRFVLLGGFDLRAYGQMQVWLRLLQADAPKTSVRMVFFGSGWGAKELEELETMLPLSLSSCSFAGFDADGAWNSLIAPNSLQQAFAAIVQNERSSLIMKGAPTEEAWDAFVEALREST